MASRSVFLSSIEGEEVKDKIPEDDKKTLLDAINDTTSWLDANQTAEKEEDEEKQKALPCPSFRRWPVLVAWVVCLVECLVECRVACLTWVAWAVPLRVMIPLVAPLLRRLIK